MTALASLIGPDGNALAVSTFPGTSDVTVVLLHGGGQTRAAWGGTATALAEQGWHTVAADLRGHGDSDWSPTGDYSPAAYAADIVCLVRRIDRPVVLVGASLGGMSALLAVGADPALPVRGVVLVDVAHRFLAAGAQRITSFMRDRPEGFADLGEAARAVAAYQPHRTAPSTPGNLQRNLRLVDGRLRWHWDPAILEAAAALLGPAGTRRHEQQLREVIVGLQAPIRLIRGEHSDIVTPEIAADFLTLNPRAERVDVPGARHMVAGDRNDAFTASVLDFLAQHVAAPGR
jgi:pimeloyl-ACP methyl ester carboxylesterase